MKIYSCILEEAEEAEESAPRVAIELICCSQSFALLMGPRNILYQKCKDIPISPIKPSSDFLLVPALRLGHWSR
jgi:hypothetical protein